MMHFKTARRMAITDIVATDPKELSRCYKKNKLPNEVWNVSAWSVASPESVRLNRELGLNKINYIGNKNGLNK